MVLWDSRTIHAPLPPQILQLYPRCVHYVCLYPKKYCRKAILKKELKLLKKIEQLVIIQLIQNYFQIIQENLIKYFQI